MELSNSKIIIFWDTEIQFNHFIPVIGYGSATSDEICYLFAYNQNTVQIFPLLNISIILKHKNQTVHQKQRKFFSKILWYTKKECPWQGILERCYLLDLPVSLLVEQHHILYEHIISVFLLHKTRVCFVKKYRRYRNITKTEFTPHPILGVHILLQSYWMWFLLFWDLLGLHVMLWALKKSRSFQKRQWLKYKG